MKWHKRYDKTRNKLYNQISSYFSNPNLYKDPALISIHGVTPSDLLTISLDSHVKIAANIMLVEEINDVYSKEGKDYWNKKEKKDHLLFCKDMFYVLVKILSWSRWPNFLILLMVSFRLLDSWVCHVQIRMEMTSNESNIKGLEMKCSLVLSHPLIMLILGSIL